MLQGAPNPQTGLSQAIRTVRNVAPLTLKDGSVSVIGPDVRTMTQVISTTTSLTPAQLIVTQQKSGGLVGVSPINATGMVYDSD